MHKEGISWLYKELPDLIAKGVLTQGSADKLRQHYGEVKSVTKNTAILIVLGTLGALLIGLGIILLFAHNWEQLPRFSRAILSFMPLVLGQYLALLALQKKPQSGAFKEGSATFLSLMVGASISLISQTYNLPADAGAFILTWMFLIIPITYLMQASIPAAIYLIGITIWSGIHVDDPVKAILFWPLSAIVLPHFIWALRHQVYALRTAILSLIAMICISIAVGFSLGRIWPSSWVIVFPSLYSIFYLLGWLKVNRATTNWQQPLRLVGSISLFVLAFMFTFGYNWKYLGSERWDIFNLTLLADYIVILAIIGEALFLFYDNFKRKISMVGLFAAVPLLAIIAYQFKGQSVVLPLLIFNTYVFVLSICQIASGFRSNSLSRVNAGMLMLGIFILARFFDSGISFIIKGLAFIVVGIGFLVVNLELADRLKGGAK